MPLFWYTKSKEANGRQSATQEEWNNIQKEWKHNHPVLHVINEVWDFFYYPINRFWDSVRTFFRITLPSFFVRGYRGWADCDTWGWAYTNAKVQRDALKHLKKYKHGIPSMVIPKNCKLDKDRNPTEDEFKRAEQVWDSVLDQIIKAFDYIIQMEEGNLEQYCPKVNKKWQKEHAKKFNIKFMTRQQDREMKKGLQLYIKHYFSLWD